MTDVEYGDSRFPQVFWDRVHPEPNTGCWLWSGGLYRAGYGTYQAAPNTWGGYAHRATLSLREELVTGLVVDHLCRVRSCVNPAHLEQVPQSVNMLRGGMTTLWEARCRNNHVRTPENTAVRSDGRICRICERSRGSRYRSNLAAA